MTNGPAPLGGPSNKVVLPAEDREPPAGEQRSVSPEAHPDARLFTPRSTPGAEDISATAIGRRAIPARTIAIFNAALERAAPTIEVPPSRIAGGIAGLLGGIFANRGPLSDHGRIEDYRNTAAVNSAMAAPLAAPADALGPLTIFRPGLGNTAPGPAQIARLAQYTDKLIIAFANPGTGEEARLRPVTEVDGVALPAELQGKVFAIGSPKNLMVSFEQGSDLFLEQLEAMKKSPHLAGIDLANAGATVVAHSQGGLDALLTRKRLIAAGFENTIGRLATLATPFRGSPISDETMFGLFTEGLGVIPDLRQAMGAVNALDPHHVAKRITDADQHLVDVSLIGQTESGDAGKKDIRRFFKVSDAAIEIAKRIPSMFKGADIRENDGLVTRHSQKFGVIQYLLEKSYDHAGIAEDWRVADDVARLLARQ